MTVGNLFSEAEGPRILVIEDNPDHAHFILTALKKCGYSTQHIADGLEAYQYLSDPEQQAEVVVLDYHLPSMDGLSIIKKLCVGGKGNCHAAFIFLTVESGLETAVEAMKAGAMDFMPKIGRFYDELPHMVAKVYDLYHNRRENRRMQQELAEREELFRMIFNNSNDAVYMSGLQENGLPGCFIEVNPLACSRLGYSREEYLTMTPIDLMDNELSVNIHHVMNKLREKGSYTFETVQAAKDGKRVPVEISSSLFQFKGEPRLIHVVRDITERTLAAQKLTRSLLEKELLLREVHHRVKNNLSIIYSILHFQKQYASRQFIESILENTQNRIKSLVLVHEKLYGSSDLTHIDFEDYTRDLATHLISASKLPAEKILCRIDFPKSLPEMDIDVIIPCGLIINELVTNALKHAFPNQRTFSAESGTTNQPNVEHPESEKMEIRIRLQAGNGNYVLTVSDNGTGIPVGFEKHDSGSLGMFIVRSLVEQLEGTFEWKRDNGSTFIISFGAK